MNGYVHLIDRVLMMPESTSDLLRDDPKLSKLRKALIDTDVAVTVNDTSTHLGQTVFAPTNKAFEKLGSKANQFLFSPYGKEYLRALLQYHIVANQTMFSNLLFPHNGAAQIPLENGSRVGALFSSPRTIHHLIAEQNEYCRYIFRLCFLPII